MHGVLQDAHASTEQVVIKAAEALNVTLQRKDIEISHKRYRAKGIIAKFLNHKVQISTLQRTDKIEKRQAMTIFLVIQRQAVGIIEYI